MIVFIFICFILYIIDGWLILMIIYFTHSGHVELSQGRAVTAVEHFVTAAAVYQNALGLIVARTVVVGEELADAKLVQPVGNRDDVHVHVVHVTVHVPRLRGPHHERPERSVTPLAARVRVPEVRALVVGQVHVPEGTVRRNRTLRHVRDAVHVRRVALVVPMPVDGRRLLHHGVFHVHHDRVAQAHLWNATHTLSIHIIKVSCSMHV